MPLDPRDVEIRALLLPRLEAATTRQEKTREAASLLFFNYGIYPSAKVVHAYTGRGSMTDINGDLRAFWAELREKSRVKLEAPMLPEAVVGRFGQALGEVWELALAQANAALDGERQEAAVELDEMRRSLQEAERLRRVAEVQVQASDQELRAERERRATAEQRSEGLAVEIAGLQAALAQAQGLVANEAQARQVAEARFSADLAAERAARLRDAEMLGGEIRFAKLQIDAARVAERELREALKAQQANSELELVAMRQRASRAEAAAGEARLEVAAISGRYAELQGRLQGLGKVRVGVAAKAGVRRRTLR